MLGVTCGYHGFRLLWGSSPCRVMQINRDAMGGRPEPQSGLQVCFEPQNSSFKDTNSLSGKEHRLENSHGLVDFPRPHGSHSGLP